MKNSLRSALVAVLFAGGMLHAEVVEEETWYSASGEVVKKVTRTYTGADADRSPDWEPAWVVRERQAAAARTFRFSSSRTRWGGSRCHTPFYLYPSSWYGGCGHHAAPYRSGFSGFYRSGGGGSKWGVSFRTRGLSVGWCD